ncbi:MAG: hypothetical protein JNL57_07220 [Bacteroidetes bacterium]|nr:hypothetical protein [Bacteroidota bacterium]
MNSRSTIWIVSITAIVLALLLYWLLSSGAETKWEPRLKKEGTEPYDLSVFHHTLKNTWGTQYTEIAENSSLEKSISRMNPANGDVYCYAGKNWYLTKKETELLQKFVSAGGHVFVSTYGFSSDLNKSFQPLKNYELSNFTSQTALSVFRNKTLRQPNTSFTFFNGQDTVKLMDWFYFIETNKKPLLSEQDFEDALSESDPDLVVTLSELNSKGPDFLRVHYGAGTMMLHTNPLFFSNYFLKSEQGRQYLAQCISHMPAGRLWYDLSGGIQKPESRTGYARRDMLDFIRSSRGLSMAWNLMLAGIGLFLLFSGRRLQRIIPVKEPPANSTLAFADAIGYFYYSENENTVVFRREWNQFVQFLRFHYRIHEPKNTAEDIARLSEKSGVPERVIQHVYNQYEKFRLLSALNQDDLLEMNIALTQFYTSCNKTHGKFR